MSSSSSSRSTSRLGNLGIFSIGVIAFALTTLQGCASPMVTASSLKEPSGPNASVVGQIRADERTHVEPRYVPESRVADRSTARSNDGRGSRHDVCRRCSN